MALATTLCAQTNKYYNANENWYQIHRSTSGYHHVPPTIFDKFYIQGDSLLGGKTYKKLFHVSKIGFATFSDFQGSTTVPACLIKEENDTITALSFMGSDTITDSLILHYDFAAGTFYERIYYSDQSPYVEANHWDMESMADSVIINGVKRRKWHYQHGVVYEGAVGIGFSRSHVIASTGLMQLDGYNYPGCYGGADSVYSNVGFVPYSSPLPYFGDCDIENVQFSSVDETETMGIHVYPNPTTGSVSIQVPQGFVPKRVQCINLFGQPMPMHQTGNAQWDMAHLPAGLYTLLIETEQGSIRKKLVKK